MRLVRVGPVAEGPRGIFVTILDDDLDNISLGERHFLSSLPFLRQWWGGGW